MATGVDDEVSKFRASLVFILAGFFTELFCLWDLTPATFLLFVGVSVPLNLVGVAIFVRMLWREIHRKAM